MKYTYDKIKMVESPILKYDEEIIKKHLKDADCYKVESNNIHFDNIIFYCNKELKDCLIHGIYFKQID